MGAFAKLLYLSIILWLLAGCATSLEVNERIARAQGLSRAVIEGSDFSHVVYIEPVGEGSLWHIYIEGDGRPWRSRYSVAPDPTAPRPLMLRLMQQDAAPRIYLGRPCYQGMVNDPACNPWVWTHGRYSEPVVSSMQSVLEQLIDRHGIKQLVLIGHSGGGALAMLLAERIPQTETVVTLAGNLDTEAWTEKHGYSVLVGSLNPAQRPPLPQAINQLHFRGIEDRNLPAATPEVISFDGVGHSRGWEAVYCEVLARMGGVCRPPATDEPGK
jgi:hypothetical protein